MLIPGGSTAPDFSQNFPMKILRKFTDNFLRIFA